MFLRTTSRDERSLCQGAVNDGLHGGRALRVSDPGVGWRAERAEHADRGDRADRPESG
jgi:hypothetical protein